MESVVSFKNISKRYKSGDFWKPIRAVALDDVSFQVEAGSVFGLIGLNGAGKTTLMKTAVGLLIPDKGSVRLFGQDPRDASTRSGFGYLPELPYFPKYLSANEVLSFYGRLHGLNGRELGLRVAGVLEKVGLTQAAKDPISRYSKGMQQRVGLAQTLIHDPRLVFLDEPMSGLDPSGMKEMRDVILGLKAQGKTIFFNSHTLAEVERICDHVGIMHRGRMLKVESVAALVAGQASNVTLGLSRLSAAALKKVRALKLKMRQENQLWIVDAPNKKLSQVLDRLRKAGVHHPSILSIGSPLETAFLSLTRRQKNA